MKTVYVLRVAEDSTRMILGDKHQLLEAINQEIDDTTSAGVMPEDEGGMTLLIHTEEWTQEQWDAFVERTKDEDFPGW